MAWLLVSPLSGVVATAPPEGWIAVDDDPQFEIVLPRSLRPSWVRLTVEIEPDGPWRSNPVLYLDTGAGYSELTAIQLPQPSANDDRVELIFKLPANLCHARLDPVAQAGSFRMGPLRISQVSKLCAGAEMALEIARRRGPAAVLARLRAALASTSRTGLRQLAEWIVVEYRTLKGARSQTYIDWLARYDTGVMDLPHATAAMAQASPLITVVIPLDTTPTVLAARAVRSLFTQQYGHWQLLLCGEPAVAQHALQVADPTRAHDDRIAVINCLLPLTSQRCNAALAAAKGDWFLVLNPTDALHPMALRALVQAARLHEEAQLIYPDEDQLNDNGTRTAPLFKPDLNPLLLLSDPDAVGEWCAWRTVFVRQLGGYRDSADGVHQYDLLLRALERIDRAQVVHLPRVLCHRGTPSLPEVELTRRAELRRRLVGEHLQRRGTQADVLPAPEAPTLSRVRFALPTPPPRVSIIIPTRDRADLLRMCIESIWQRSTYRNFELIVVDNNSEEQATIELFEQLEGNGVVLLHDQSFFNFSRLNNLAVRQASGEFLCLMNNDIEIVTSDWIEEMLSFAALPDVGAVGARLWYPDGRLQHAGVILGIGGVAGHVHKHLRRGEPGYARRAIQHQELSAVTAAVLMVSKDKYVAVGGLDETLEVAFNDVDFCLKLRAQGWRTVWTPFAEMIHHESASRGAETTPEKQERFQREILCMQSRWGSLLLSDPAYSPNLTLAAETCALAWPPRPHALVSSGSEMGTQSATEFVSFR